MQAAIDYVKERAAKTPNSFVAGQFENQDNPDFHYETTAREFYDQLGGQIDAIVIGCGTGGTFTGVARYLKERNPKTLAIAVETEGSVLGGGPKGDHEVEGIGASFIPKTFDGSLADEIIAVTDRDAFDMVKKLAAMEGVLAGSSAGANVFAAIGIARTTGPGQARGDHHSRLRRALFVEGHLPVQRKITTEAQSSKSVSPRRHGAHGGRTINFILLVATCFLNAINALSRFVVRVLPSALLKAVSQSEFAKLG